MAKKYVELRDVDAYGWTCPKCEAENITELPCTRVKCYDCQAEFNARMQDK